MWCHWVMSVRMGHLSRVKSSRSQDGASQLKFVKGQDGASQVKSVRDQNTVFLGQVCQESG